MKRNWELVRKILIKLEEQADASAWLEADAIVGFDVETVNYHMRLLNESGLMLAQDVGGLNGTHYVAKSLTWAGHEFLDKIRSDTVWNKIKSTAKGKGLDLSVDVIKLVAGAVIGAML